MPRWPEVEWVATLTVSLVGSVVEDGAPPAESKLVYHEPANRAIATKY